MQAAPEPSGARLVFTLMLAGLLSGLAIVSVYEWTLPIIERNNAAALERAVFKVVPGSAQMQALMIDDTGARTATAGDTPHIFAAYDDAGAFVGYAIAAQGPGFQDTIRLLYGYDPAQQRIIGMEILDSRETPGLGDKIYKDMGFVGDFDALSVVPPIVCVKAGAKVNDNEVDAITGATISSKAVVRIIGLSNEQWLAKLPGPDDVPPLAKPEIAGDAP